jgi:flagellar protein FliO/FliZ
VIALFGEGQQFYTLLLAFIAVFTLLVLAYWLVRQFRRGQRIGVAPHRRRQRRIGIVETAAIDARRRVTLIRRDNVEHLLLVGGGADVVIEPRIVRAAEPIQEPAPPPQAGGDILAGPVEIAPGPPARQPRPPVQEQRTQSAAAPPLPPVWLQRRIHSEDPAGLAKETTDEQTSDEIEKTVTPPRAPPQRVSRGRRQPMSSAAAPEESKLSTRTAPDLGEMKRRLEAALSRPSKHDERRADTETSQNETETHAPALQPAHPQAAEPLKPARKEASSARSERQAVQSLHEGLEQEMAQASPAPSENADDVRTKGGGGGSD